jgi:hypothetical protein
VCLFGYVLVPFSSYQFYPIRHWQIEQEKILEAVTDRNATHPLQIGPASEDRSSVGRVRRQIGKGDVRSR